MHKHYKLALQYAEDMNKYEKPWTKWQFQHEHTREWRNATECPKWHNVINYRRIPDNIMVNEIKVPEPLREAEDGMVAYITSPIDRDYYLSHTFEGDNHHSQRLLERGLLHDSAESAIAHAKAMLQHK